MSDWIFDQQPNAAAITTKQVIEEGLPILTVIHYIDDHSWGFFCGTTDNEQDGRVIGMQEILSIDPSIAAIADLRPGWKAFRNSVDSQWQRFEL